ncbi:MAG: outer membrane protein assembly factor BamB [Verrucomicrobiales bacterium]
MCNPSSLRFHPVGDHDTLSSAMDTISLSHRATLIIALLSITCSMANSEWPTYRRDSHRSAVSWEAMSSDLHLQWVFKPKHGPQTAWPLPGEETPRMHTDRAYHVVCAHGLAFFGTSVDNKVYALDVQTGTVRWMFYTGGSVRFAPVIDGERLYVGSDDGYAYCLNAKDGELVWKYRPSPANERIVGNGRLVSSWPLRTGMLVDNGVLFLTAGVFPYEGLYVCAVNAETGEEIWKNDTSGDLAWGLDYGGMAPQGYLLASKKNLYVPSGRGMPASFDRRSGKFIRFLPAGGKVGGSWALIDATGDQLVAGVNNQGAPAKIAYDDETGKRKGDIFASFPGIDLVLTPDVAFSLTETGVVAINRQAYRKAAGELPKIAAHRTALGKLIDENRKKTKELQAQIAEFKKSQSAGDADKLTDSQKQVGELRIALTGYTKEIASHGEREKVLKAPRVKWTFDHLALSNIVLAGGTLFGSGEGVALALDARSGEKKSEVTIKGTVLGMAASDDRLFLSTDEGPIYCLGAEATKTPNQITPYADADAFGDTSAYAAAAKTILQYSGIDKGYCLVLNAGEGELAYELASQSELSIVAIESDPNKIRAAREKLDAAGYYGSRVIIEDWEHTELPDYFANLIVSGSDSVSASAEETYRTLRPAGGVVMFASSNASWLATMNLPEAEKVAGGNWLKATRPRLENSGEWTGLYGNVGNTASSPDDHVRGPFGVLWYGEPGSKYMLDRHARSVSPLAVNGRLLVQGEEEVMGFDAYNGTFLWQRHIPGAVRSRVDVDGSNITATGDHMFVAAFDKVHQLNAQTGELIKEFDMPIREDGLARRWGYIAVDDGVLYGSAALPLKHEFGHIWNTLKRGDAWIPENEVPDDLKEAYKKIVERMPMPTLDGFKRSGFNWVYTADFPGWLPDHKPAPINEKMMVSDALFALDIDSGNLLWQRASRDVPAISITIGGGLIHFIENDLDIEERNEGMKQREDLIADGIYEAHDEGTLKPEDRDVRRVLALDAKTGKQVWSKPVDLSGCGGNKLGTAYHKGSLLFFGHYSNHDQGPFVKGDLAWRRITTMSSESGSFNWSKPLNYRRRPLIMGDTIYIEPRACSLLDGTIKEREHPITGDSVDWEFLRPGHSCGIVTASPHSIFYRSFCAAIVNVEKDTGLQLFGGIRPGCWNNLIPGNGLVSMQESSAGCTCSYSLRTTVVLKNKKQKGPGEWSVFISNAPNKPVSHLAVNFGAPGDMRDEGGTLWFAYPRPDTHVGQGSFANYGIKFDLKENAGVEVLQRDFRGVTINGTDRPWIYTNGVEGLTECRLPLIEKDKEPVVYNVRIGFVPARGQKPGERVFSIQLQDQLVLADFDAAEEAGRSNKMVMKLFRGVQVTEDLVVKLIPKKTDKGVSAPPIVHSIEVLRAK